VPRWLCCSFRASEGSLHIGDVVHPSSGLHSSLWLLPLFRDSCGGEAQDLMLGFHGPTMGGVTESGGVAFPMRPGLPNKAFSAVSAMRRGPMRMTAWRLQGSLRVAAVWRIYLYQSISWESLLPLVGDVLGYIAPSQWNCGWSLGDRMGKFVMKTSWAWVGHLCVLMMVSVVLDSSSVMWKDVNWVRLSASASGQPMLPIARIWWCCSHRVASGDNSATF
jgi:hypothetical protein